MSTRATLLQASIVADSLVLPAHWIYDQAVLDARFGRVTELLAPAEDSYHKGQPAGGQTHYGAQALILMASLQATGGFDLADFAARWQAYWAAGPATYRDGATRTTLERLAEGLPVAEAGSPSTDLGGAARIAPLVVATAGLSEDEAVAAVWAQTGMTHKQTSVCEAAAFLTRAARASLGGASVAEAIERAAGAEYLALPVAQHLATARGLVAQGLTPAAVAQVGLACPVDQSFPVTLALALAYPTNLEEALVQNVSCGGDQAARGMALGLLLGAAPGAVVPERWLAAWQARPAADAFLAASGAA